MSTHAMIGVLHGDKCKAVYSHSDGYLAYTGRMLLDHYSDSPKVNHLVSLGDISMLKRAVIPTGTTHTFDTPETGVTVFYGRDRSDQETEFQVYDSDTELFECGAVDFYYVMKDGVWYFSNGYHGWMTLKDALRTVDENEGDE
jgi:hypothetical protein